MIETLKLIEDEEELLKEFNYKHYFTKRINS